MDVYFHIVVHHERKSERQDLEQGKNLEAAAEAMEEECCLRACSHGLLSLLS